MPEPPAKKQRNMPESTFEETNGCNGSEVHEENGHGHSNGDSQAMKNGGKIPKRMETCTHEQEPTDNSVLLCKRLSEDAYLPTRGSRSAAGFDLYSAKNTMIEAKNKGLVPTQLAITVPFGSYGRIAPRSGLACKKFIDVGAGVIDHDYTGEVKVLLFNFSDEDFEIKKGDRIAQLVIEKIFMPELREVEDLQKTDRGATGFGASGK